MPRIFLSHSTDDKDYVEDVAGRLGPHKALLDVQAFSPGEDFRDAIRRALDDTVVFAFFVSNKSLSSSWVKFEIDEAELRNIRRTLKRAIAIFIDGPVDPSLLPEWLARVRAVQHDSPSQTARTLEALLFSVAPEATRPFIGRNTELQRGTRKLLMGDPSPRIIVATGLPGIGRRSYLARLMSDAFNVEVGPIIPLTQTATLEDLFLQTRLSARLLSREEAERDLEAFRTMPVNDQVTEVAQQLSFIGRQGSMPCLLDEGSMLDDVGKYRPEYGQLLSQFLTFDGVYMALVHTRAPNLRGLDPKTYLLETRLGRLARPDAQVLIGRLLRDAGVSVDPGQTSQLAEMTDGYPPAAYYLTSQIENYGIEVVLSDTSLVAEFTSGSFSRFLHDLKLSSIEKDILAYLASESRLSLSGIAAAIGSTLEDAAVAIRLLLDLNLVEVSDGEYAVASPIQTTLLRAGNGLNRRWYEKAFQRLEEQFWSERKALPSISIVDATLRAGMRIGRNGIAGYGALVRPSLLVQAAEESYHKSDYDTCLGYLERAETMGRVTPLLLELRIKSLAQLGDVASAREALRRYRESGERRQWYLDGFIARKANDHQKACERFQRGYSQGDRSTSMLRDYADSLLITGSCDQARGIAQEALTRDSTNVYLLDLVARIEIAGGTLEDAEAALDVLQTFDRDERRILVRRATFFLYRKGGADGARRALRLAESATDRRDATFEAYVVLVKALIRNKKWSKLDDARDELSKKRGRIESDGTLRRLDLETAVARGEWRRGEQLLGNGRHGDENTDLRIEVMQLKQNDAGVGLSERHDAENEARKLRKQLESGNTRPVMEMDQYE